MKSAIQLDPVLKSWLDNVIIPALLREYLSELRARREKEVASDSDCRLVSISETPKSKEAH